MPGRKWMINSQTITSPAYSMLSRGIKTSMIKIPGKKIYDPRDKKFKVSDNPALVMADLAKSGFIKTSWEFNELFWKKIEQMANFCDDL